MESLRPDVVAKRAAYLNEIRNVPTSRLVFLDESGMNLSMSRSHAWVKRGEELIDRVPMNWGKNLTLLGAVRLTGWVVLTSMFATANKDRFVAWMKSKLLPRLRRGDVVVMDNLGAHHDSRVAPACAEHGVRVMYLPPYSPDFNPIESGWALQKQYVRRIAPRQPDLLRRVARRARHRVTAALPELVLTLRLPSSSQVIPGVSGVDPEPPGGGSWRIFGSVAGAPACSPPARTSA